MKDMLENKRSSHVQILFKGYMVEWKETTKHLSIGTHDNEHYRKIVALGDEVIPHILYEVARRPSWIVVALAEITKENPVLEEHQGRLQAVVNDWLTWGIERGHIS
jgi:hypothetical protein